MILRFVGQLRLIEEKTMSALQVVIDGFLTAAELVALLFVSPVSAAEQPNVAHTRSAPAYERARE